MPVRQPDWQRPRVSTRATRRHPRELAFQIALTRYSGVVFVCNFDRIDAAILSGAQDDAALDPLDVQGRIVDPAVTELLIRGDGFAHDLDDVIDAARGLEALEDLGCSAHALLESRPDLPALLDVTVSDNDDVIDEAVHRHACRVSRDHRVLF